MWELGIKVLEELRSKKIKNNIPVIAGGVFNLCSEICIKNELVDMVCVGEGENALVDLCNRLKNNETYNDVTNLWIKSKDNKITKNKISKPVDINKNPKIDVTSFEEKDSQTNGWQYL